ncbi:hypothetical protein PAECIP111893_00286 [Paenibacillus plantiphilus]|uniref:Uncharacterized protein n=1 Tax=Paenibacillus plantiphilus TaxID=2905650 RepID=A0ABN8FQL3_9BACL|nr:hypothetical protein PAECIP111893_00286 [Paenibacillus plantiphilus]
MDVATQMINAALRPLRISGNQIDRFKLFVCAGSRIAQRESIYTNYGPLRIEASFHIPKGLSYVIEDPTGKRGRRFAWVSRKAEDK